MQDTSSNCQGCSIEFHWTFGVFFNPIAVQLKDRSGNAINDRQQLTKDAKDAFETAMKKLFGDECLEKLNVARKPAGRVID